jgi:hypothetical protein
MTVPKKRGGRAKGYFPRVAEAKKILTDEAVELLKLYKQIAVEALAAQEFETAEVAVRFLLAHMPEDEETGTLLGTDVDKNREPDQKGGGGPTIQIGLALGGMPQQKALPTVTIVEPKESE